jgi:hypothetical protein
MILMLKFFRIQFNIERYNHKDMLAIKEESSKLITDLEQELESLE